MPKMPYLPTDNGYQADGTFRTENAVKFLVEGGS